VHESHKQDVRRALFVATGSLGAWLALRILRSTTTAGGVHVWPDQLDAAATMGFLLVTLGLGSLGYLFIVVDFRAYLRSMRRALVVVVSRFPKRPEWARPYTPPSISALGLTMPCTEADVLKAYRARAMELHPDRGGNRRQFVRVQKQFEQAIRHLREQQPDWVQEPNSKGE